MKAALAWGAVIIPAWVMLAYGASWDFVMNDGWTHVYWYRDHSLSLGSAWTFMHDAWLNENPRLGQFVTLALYSSTAVHAIVTPLVELASFAMATALALGRWPSPRRAGDALAFATVTALVALCTPQLGSLLFYRPFVGNYTFGLALDLAWILPFAIAPDLRTRYAPLMFVLGFAAGMCNEHTGAALLALGALLAWRRGVRAWMIAALVGLAAGYAMLLLAPGQDVRYDALATKAGLVERIADRGAAGNAHAIGFLFSNLLRAVPWIALGALKWRDAIPKRIWLAAAVSLAITFTLLASPVIGPRLYFASVVAASIAIAAWCVPRAPWQLLAPLAALALGYTGWQLASHIRAFGPPGDERYARISHANGWITVDVPDLPATPSRYFIGDDFAKRREALTVDYHVAAIRVSAKP
jgi:uncharacterized protein DUF6056